MQSTTEVTENEVLNPLPPFISINLRQKLDAEKASLTGLIVHKKKHDKLEVSLKPSDFPKPLHALEIFHHPKSLHFDVEELVIIKRLRVWNPCPRSIYIHCCGLWDESCRLGAVWRCYPRTRFLLAPGLTADIFVKATPNSYTPIPCATVGLQLAASHMRDTAVGHFLIPIHVEFLKYVPPPIGEAE